MTKMSKNIHSFQKKYVRLRKEKTIKKWRKKKTHSSELRVLDQKSTKTLILQVAKNPSLELNK